MYLNIGKTTVIQDDELIGIFDLTTVLSLFSQENFSRRRKRQERS